MFYASMDWDGNGVIDGYDMGIEIGVVQSIADDLAREERISRMEAAIRSSELEEIDNDSFRELCDQIHIPMSEFEQADITELQRRLR